MTHLEVVAHSGVVVVHLEVAVAHLVEVAHLEDTSL
jgi:hypothetical protein